MALITLVIKDAPDGSLDVQAHAEPYIPSEPEAELTPAQTAAQVMVAALAEVLQAEAAIAASLADDSEAGETPKLEVVGEVE